MKLILRHSWRELYVNSGVNTYPFEYSSKEDAFVDFTQANEDTDYRFEFCGREFYKSNNDDYEFFELEEWFENHKIN